MMALIFFYFILYYNGNVSFSVRVEFDMIVRY